MGRPRADDGEGRYYTLRVRLSNTEKQHLDDICTEYGCTQSELIRLMLKDQHDMIAVAEQCKS